MNRFSRMFSLVRILVAPIGVALAISACSSKVSTPGAGTVDKGKYNEDLSAFRPRLEIKTDTAKSGASTSSGNQKVSQYVEPKFAVNQQLDTVLDSIRKINLANGFVEGYTIQLYSGTRREDALNVKKQISSLLPQVTSEIQFAQPNYRVRAGKYYDRFQAQKDFTAVKRYFPNAIVIPDRIPIKP